MKHTDNRLIQIITPFFILGIGIALLIALLVLFSYVLIWGVLIGAVLAVIAWIKQALFPPKKMDKKEKHGRIIEHDDK